MKKSTAAAVLMVAATAAGAASSDASQRLNAVSRNGKVLVTVTVENRSARPVHVLRTIADPNAIFNGGFEIRESTTGELVRYVGSMIKRGPITAADYLEVKAGSTHENTIDITKHYAFLLGRHSYRLQYKGVFLPDLKQLKVLTPAEVAPVTFTHIQTE